MHYIWIIWSLILIAIWLAVYTSLNSGESRREMLLVSLWTSLLGLTEPLFVPEYWNPPSLFDLAQRTGFDIESLIFSFGIGGLAVVIYEKLFHTEHEQISMEERHKPLHKFHIFFLSSAPVIFILLFIFTDLNSIYSASIALILGGLSAWYCRPDLKRKMIASAFLFLGIYFIYFLSLIALYPGYVENVWNFQAISGILIFGIPFEELMFAFSFGFLWSGIYEHLMWRKLR